MGTPGQPTLMDTDSFHFAGNGDVGSCFGSPFRQPSVPLTPDLIELTGFTDHRLLSREQQVDLEGCYIIS